MNLPGKKKDNKKEITADQYIEHIKQAEATIENYKTQNEFLLNCLNSIDEGITICDRDGRLLFYNKTTLEIMGPKVEEVLNKKMIEFSNIKPLLYQVIESEKSIIDAEYKFEFDNRIIHMICSGYPLYDSSGNLIGAIDIFRGIERSRKLANKIAGYNAAYRFEDIVGKSATIQETTKIAKSFSNNTENVLIQGESGTGKELFAQSIHNFSIRNTKPFIAINCASFPNELIESELFGYEEGAFTGAKAGGKPGKFELANGGTLLLDEVGEMQFYMQAKLLRVLETKAITRVGGNKEINVDVRIIAATNRDLGSMANVGQFRKDLYYRLSVLTIQVPPLRERSEDILDLASYFLKTIGSKYRANVKGFSNDAKDALLLYKWPGNVRELESLISRVIFLCNTEQVTGEDLIKAGLSVGDNKASGIINKQKLNKINEEIINTTLKKMGGNKKKTAEVLGISRQTIYRYLSKRN